MIFKLIKPTNLLLCTALFCLSSFTIANAAECQNPDGHCVRFPGETSTPAPPPRPSGKGEKDTSANNSQADNATLIADTKNAEEEFKERTVETRDGSGQKMYFPKGDKQTNGGIECYTQDKRPGHFTIGGLPQDETANRIPNHVGGRYCVPNDTKTLTSNNPEQPKGPSPEEMLQEVEDQFANTNIQAPVLKQSYNLGTGLGEDNPNVYKNQAVNFYVDAPTARWEGDLMIGHVEMESYPTQMTIQYGNGDEGSFYTMGKPVSRARGEESRKTATSYAYQRSGNFHAYATVSYSGRFRVNGGDWQTLDVVLTKETVDPLLVRVWWVDVGRVGGTCDEDDTRWGCKNDPTMGKKDNPNPRLRKADIRTGQRWHLNDNGDGDTEYSLHRDWPDM